jgi:hypothetical protein
VVTDPDGRAPLVTHTMHFTITDERRTAGRWRPGWCGSARRATDRSPRATCRTSSAEPRSLRAGPRSPWPPPVRVVRARCRQSWPDVPSAKPPARPARNSTTAAAAPMGQRPVQCPEGRSRERGCRASRRTLGAPPRRGPSRFRPLDGADESTTPFHPGAGDRTSPSIRLNAAVAFDAPINSPGTTRLQGQTIGRFGEDSMELCRLQVFRSSHRNLPAKRMAAISGA